MSPKALPRVINQHKALQTSQKDLGLVLEGVEKKKNPRLHLILQQSKEMKENGVEEMIVSEKEEKKRSDPGRVRATPRSGAPWTSLLGREALPLLAREAASRRCGSSAVRRLGPSKTWALLLRGGFFIEEHEGGVNPTTHCTASPCLTATQLGRAGCSSSRGCTNQS